MQIQTLRFRKRKKLMSLDLFSQIYSLPHFFFPMYTRLRKAKNNMSLKSFFFLQPLEDIYPLSFN